MSVAAERLAELMAIFESGGGLPNEHINPFADFPSAEVLQIVTAFTEGNTVPETSKWVERLSVETGNDAASSYAIAGFLQGLAIGFEFGANPPW